MCYLFMKLGSKRRRVVVISFMKILFWLVDRDVGFRGGLGILINKLLVVSGSVSM